MPKWRRGISGWPPTRGGRADPLAGVHGAPRKEASTSPSPASSMDFEELLAAGVEAWNEWRIANPKVKPALLDADLSEMALEGVNFSEMDLSGADLYGAMLEGANLKMAKLPKAELSEARLSGAALYKANLAGAFLTEADLTGTNLGAADLSGADLRGAQAVGVDLTEATLRSSILVGSDLTGAVLTRADITDADLSGANLADANVLELEYGAFASMRGHYFGIRGLNATFGNAFFVRDASDQDYLDTLERRINDVPRGLRRSARRAAFVAWQQIDFGRSLSKLAGYAVIVASIFGGVYALDFHLGWGWMDYSDSAASWVSPFYYSLVTYTTLGFGDITPVHWVGEVIVVTEVVLGYVTLGMLLSILANRVARRA